MRFRELVKEVEYWVDKQNFGGELWYRSTKDLGVIGFDIRTTKTRASSIVTRLELMILDIAKEHQFKVGHELMSEAPKDRDDLATWTIYTVISKRRANLSVELETAKANLKSAAKEFREVVSDVPSGIPHQDGVYNLKRVGSNYRNAMVQLGDAVRREAEFSAKTLPILAITDESKEKR